MQMQAISVDSEEQKGLQHSAACRMLSSQVFIIQFVCECLTAPKYVNISEMLKAEVWEPEVVGEYSRASIHILLASRPSF